MIQRALASCCVVLLCIFVPFRLTVADTGTNLESGPLRVFHFVLRGVDLAQSHWMVSEARAAGFNAVQVVITDGVRLDNAPWASRHDAWSKEEFVAWVDKTRASGIEVIPELKLLSHQEKFFQGREKSLMYNRSTYDPHKDETYQRVYAVIDEIIASIRPKAIHIGHDEVAGHNAGSEKKWLAAGESMLPADLFLADVLRVHAYLKERGVAVWMWGDMLIAPDEFPGMLPKHLHGTKPGYGAALRARIPRDIVICDWHYNDEQRDFPSLLKMQQEGFRVIGATFKNKSTINNFSSYAAEHRAYGMMATTWFYVQRKRWDTVSSIIRDSGMAFQRGFPDAR